MQTIRNLFAHMDWANRRLLEALQAAPAEEARKAATLFMHVLQAERIWLSRLCGESSLGIALLVDNADPDACAALIEANGSGFEAWLDALPENWLDKPIAYSSQAGAPFETSARDIFDTCRPARPIPSRSDQCRSPRRRVRACYRGLCLILSTRRKYLNSCCN